VPPPTRSQSGQRPVVGLVLFLIAFFSGLVLPMSVGATAEPASVPIAVRSASGAAAHGVHAAIRAMADDVGKMAPTAVTMLVAHTAGGGLATRTGAASEAGIAAAEEASGASSATNGARLSEHLRQLEEYGEGGFRELENGRIRYYGEIDAADKPGEVVGRRLVREWDPETGYKRTWHETLDQNGRVRIVRPETGGPKAHYFFDEYGGYEGSW
jgi:hypothetical protein